MYKRGVAWFKLRSPPEESYGTLVSFAPYQWRRIFFEGAQAIGIIPGSVSAARMLIVGDEGEIYTSFTYGGDDPEASFALSKHVWIEILFDYVVRERQMFNLENHPRGRRLTVQCFHRDDGTRTSAGKTAFFCWRPVTMPTAPVQQNLRAVQTLSESSSSTRTLYDHLI